MNRTFWIILAGSRGNVFAALMMAFHQHISLTYENGLYVNASGYAGADVTGNILKLQQSREHKHPKVSLLEWMNESCRIN